MGLSYFVALDLHSRTTDEYMERLGFNGLPFVVLVGRDGRVKWSGHPMETTLEDEIKNLAAQ